MSSARNIDGKSLTPATADNLAPLVGSKVTLLRDGEVIVRLVSAHQTEANAFVGTTTTGRPSGRRTHRIHPTDLIVG
jgi:hypothetical protein